MLYSWTGLGAMQAKVEGRLNKRAKNKYKRRNKKTKLTFINHHSILQTMLFLSQIFVSTEENSYYIILLRSLYFIIALTRFSVWLLNLLTLLLPSIWWGFFQFHNSIVSICLEFVSLKFSFYSAI